MLRVLDDTNNEATDRLLTNVKLRSTGEINETAAVRLDNPERLLRDLIARISAEPLADADSSVPSYPQLVAR